MEELKNRKFTPYVEPKVSIVKNTVQSYLTQTGGVNIIRIVDPEGEPEEHITDSDYRQLLRYADREIDNVELTVVGEERKIRATILLAKTKEEQPTYLEKNVSKGIIVSDEETARFMKSAHFPHPQMPDIKVNVKLGEDVYWMDFDDGILNKAKLKITKIYEEYSGLHIRAEDSIGCVWLLVPEQFDKKWFLTEKDMNKYQRENYPNIKEERENY